MYWVEDGRRMHHTGINNKMESLSCTLWPLAQLELLCAIEGLQQPRPIYYAARLVTARSMRYPSGALEKLRIPPLATQRPSKIPLSNNWVTKLLYGV